MAWKRIVGIGASAGGLKALETLLESLPNNLGFTYVIIQHLSPDYDSLMDQLLGRHTSMPVHVIEDSATPRPNCIYLLPPGALAIYSGERLLLTDRARGERLSFPVDEFFRSLGQNAGEKAVGIILSGTGTDGTRGAVEVHDGGGVVMAQLQEEATFDGMPRSVCETGVVDYVLGVKEMARTLVRLSGMGEEFATKSEAVTAESFLENEVARQDHVDLPTRLIFHQLHEAYGLDFTQYKASMIARRLQRRLQLANSQTVEEYSELVRSDPAELDRLYHDMLIGVTEFFRDARVFERIELDVIPGILDRLPPEAEFRGWVAGAASGEEAYSLAMLLIEEFERRGQAPRARIFASDVHEPSLKCGDRGIFSESQMAGVTPERRERFFIARQDGYHVAAELRRLIVFSPHNVIRDAPFTRLDFISCRNLLIYFTPRTQQRVISLFHFGLKQDGTLVLGNSETLGELEQEFTTVDESLRIYRRRRSNAAAAAPRASMRTYSPPVIRETPVATDPGRQVLKAYDALLSKIDLTGFLVNQSREILHIFGDGSKHLRHRAGRLSTDILEMVAPDLRRPLSLAIAQARQAGAGAVVFRQPADGDEEPADYQLSVQQLEDDERPLLVRLQRIECPTLEPQPLTTGEASTIEYLERELQTTREDLHSTIEKHQSTNEQLQSANEQLTASNEELQSTNEELHSVNEELYTVNAEHQRKIDELTELNDDIDNLLTTTNVHTLFLDQELHLRRFTPRIADLFNLIPQDVGRPISSFTHKLQDVDLLRHINAVIESEQSFQKEIKDRDGNWYLLRIFPYLSRGAVEGAVVTFVDVTTLHAAAEALQRSDERFELAVKGSNAGIWDWPDVTQEPIWCSRRMYSLLGRPRREEFTYSLWLDMIHPGDRDAVLGALDRHLESDDPFDVEYRMEHGAEGEYRWFHMRGAAERRDGVAMRMAGSLEDITDRKRAEEEVATGVARRDQFLAMLSHELRNPLGAVTNAVAVLANQSVSAARRERAWEVVERQLTQMSRLLDDLLDVSRITHGKIELRRRHVDLGRIAQQAVGVVASALEEASIEFEFSLGEEPLLVDGDPHRLEQVLVNLLTNAIKYTPAGGQVRFALSAEEDRVEVEVADSGVGISKSNLDEIFTLFYQSDETLHRSNGGMGVGLTLVNAVVEMHGGHVTVESGGLGRGSRFTVQLPRLKSGVVSEVTEAMGAGEHVRKLVLVEDSDDAREMLATLLELRGIDVHQAADGAAGLDLIREVNPDAAIVDIGLPELDGHQLARQLRADGASDLILVALTGYGQDTDRQAVRESGFNMHLVKPLDPAKIDELLASIQQLHPQLNPEDAR